MVRRPSSISEVQNGYHTPLQELCFCAVAAVPHILRVAVAKESSPHLLLGLCPTGSRVAVVLENVPQHLEFRGEWPLATVKRRVVRAPRYHAASARRLDFEPPISGQFLLKVLEDTDSSANCRASTKQIVHKRAHTEFVRPRIETPLFPKWVPSCDCALHRNPPKHASNSGSCQ